MNFTDTLIIAVDFDGTIVEDAYPRIGKPQMFAFETLKKLQEQGHRLILWTYRCEDKLDEAVKFCEDNGIRFYAVNKSFPEEEYTDNISRKINADLFIDDRNIGGFYGWGEVYQLLTNSDVKSLEYKKKKRFLDFFR
jgi:hydroxymethylpyrimidine pyrophosphatase-like HAD family hydrolase